RSRRSTSLKGRCSTASTSRPRSSPVGSHPLRKAKKERPMSAHKPFQSFGSSDSKPSDEPVPEGLLRDLDAMLASSSQPAPAEAPPAPAAETDAMKAEFDRMFASQSHD